MNVLVMGAGGVGGYLGALLARAGHRVTVIARGAHLDALQTDGLRVETVIEEDFTVPVHALSSTEPGIVSDLVLFAVKSYDAAEAIERIRPAMGPNTRVLTLLNGVDSGEDLAAAFGQERVLDGVVYIESHVKAPGIIAQTGGPRRVLFGRRGRNNGAYESELLTTLQAARWNVDISPNILGTLWAKLSFIGPFAAINTVTGLASVRLCQDEQCSRLMSAVISEYVAVGNAEGAELPADAAEKSMEAFHNFRGTSSMLRDRMAGKRLESNALVSSVVRRGTARAVATPLTDALDCLIAPMADGGANELGG